MESTRSHGLVFWMVFLLLLLSGCSNSGRYQLVAGPNNLIYRINTTTGETWRTTGAEWVAVRTSPPKRR